MPNAKRVQSYHELRLELSTAVGRAQRLTERAQEAQGLTKVSLDAWAEVGRLAVDTRHEYSMMTRESPASSIATRAQLQSLARRLVL